MDNPEIDGFLCFHHLSAYNIVSMLQGDIL